MIEVGDGERPLAIPADDQAGSSVQQRRRIWPAGDSQDQGSVGRHLERIGPAGDGGRQVAKRVWEGVVAEGGFEPPAKGL